MVKSWQSIRNSGDAGLDGRGRRSEAAIPFSRPSACRNGFSPPSRLLSGIEQSLKKPRTPCGLKMDAERARHVPLFGSPDAKQPRRLAGLSNPAGHPAAQNPGHVRLAGPGPAPPRLHSVLSEAAALEKAGPGILCLLSEGAGGKQSTGGPSLWPTASTTSASSSTNGSAA